MRKLTESELFDLKSVVEDGVRYLTLQTTDESQRMFMMTYPNHEQRQKAALAKHSYHSELGKRRRTEGLKTRRELEREYKDDLKEIRQELQECRREATRLQRELIEDMAGGNVLPDPETDPEGFDTAVAERITSKAEELNERGAILSSEIEEILQFSIEALASNEEMARLTQMCWSQATDDGWEPVWKEWGEYKEDSRPLAKLLFNETRYWVTGGVPPFAG